jgi:hypothetical protein
MQYGEGGCMTNDVTVGVLPITLYKGFCVHVCNDVNWCTSFYIILWFMFYIQVKVYISYFITYIHSFNHVHAIHFSIAIRWGLSPFPHRLYAQCETPPCGAEPRIKLGPRVKVSIIWNCDQFMNHPLQIDILYKFILGLCTSVVDAYVGDLIYWCRSLNG